MPSLAQEGSSSGQRQDSRDKDVLVASKVLQRWASGDLVLRAAWCEGPTTQVPVAAEPLSMAMHDATALACVGCVARENVFMGQCQF